MTIEGIKKHNSRYYDKEYRSVWRDREVLTIEGVRVPQYVFNGTVDPFDHKTDLANYIKARPDEFAGKRFLDIGCCAGINNILLTQAGYEVIGLDNSIYSLNASLYTMEMNDTYYKVVLGDHREIFNIAHDVLLVNQMDYLPMFMEVIELIAEQEEYSGRKVLIFS